MSSASGKGVRRKTVDKREIRKRSSPSKTDAVEDGLVSAVQDPGPGLEFNEDGLYREIEWCIGQLELGLTKQNPSSRQAQDAQKIIRILKSEKAPLIKKRQAMRNTFGDYRKKMQEEEKRTQASLKNTVMKPVEITNKSVFFRKCNARIYSQKTTNVTKSLSPDQGIVGNDTHQAGVESLVKEFKFAFGQTDSEKSECMDNKPTEDIHDTHSQIVSNQMDQSESEKFADYFKTDRSINNFCFNFQLDESHL